jgi:tetratricopeptide (TPR) repeat protein
VAKRGQPHQGSDRLGAAALVVALAATGCAGYAGDVKEIRSALTAGNKTLALERANQVLEVDEPDHYPTDVSGDNALLVLERGTVQQGLGRHKPSARDFRVADKHLELLDVKNDTAGNIGKWLFSDDVTAYKAPPHEKLLLNTLGMVNYLALGKLESARVEARRFAVMKRYLADEVSKTEANLPLGSYLAGFTYEMSGRYEEALRHYEEALASSDYRSLDEVIPRVAACTDYRSDAIVELLGEPTSTEPVGDAPAVEEPVCEADAPDKGTILVVATVGLAPYKQATRIPIGAALVIAAHVTYGPGLGASNQAQANELAAKGLLKWVNFPRLTKSRPKFDRVRVKVDGKPAASELGQNVTALVTEAWDRIKGTLMAAAIVRMITRAVAGEATHQAAEAGGAAGGLALLAGLAVEGALTAADTPDTRSWVTLPSHVVLSRIEVKPGKHKVSVIFEGTAGRTSRKQVVNVPPGGFAVVSAASMR